ncbi:MAG: hypothetical protein GX235_06540 [Clostridiales bacterium]|nr:hypothetical protein [Clostridiales bacterium]
MTFEKNYLLHIISVQVKDAWKRAENNEPVMLPYMGGEDKQENEKRITNSVERFKEQVGKFPHSISFFGRQRRWKRNTERMFHDILWKEPLLGMEDSVSNEELEAFKDQAKAFVVRVREFDSQMAIEDIGQALRNYLVYAIFKELNGLPQKCKSAIFGYSMLYPYTDNFIDDVTRSREEKEHFNRLIEDFLRGKQYETISEYEERTVKLLAAVEEDYERPDEIFEGLLLMLEAQRNSQRQSRNEVPLTEEEVLDISVFKGGLSVLIDRYFIDKPFKEEDIYFYYGFGFLLQLCDDLQDISQDKGSGSRTLFSVCGSPKETEGKINQLLRYTGSLFSAYEGENAKFQQFLLRNTYLLILFSAARSREHITEEYLLWIDKQLPLSIDLYEEFKKSFSAEMLDKEGERYGKMMDVLLR